MHRDTRLPLLVRRGGRVESLARSRGISEKDHLQETALNFCVVVCLHQHPYSSEQTDNGGKQPVLMMTCQVALNRKREAAAAKALPAAAGMNLMKLQVTESWR